MPFCKVSTVVSGPSRGATKDGRLALAVDFSATTTRSHGPIDAASGEADATRTTRSRPRVRMVRPCARMTEWSDRERQWTSWPASVSKAAYHPPTAPVPTMAILMGGPADDGRKYAWPQAAWTDNPA